MYVRARRMRRCTQCEKALRHRTSPYIDARGPTRRKSPYRTATRGMRQRMAPYARLTQAKKGPKHDSNLTHVTSRDKFQSCH